MERNNEEVMRHGARDCVLVVDDEPDLCLTIQLVLRLQGYDVVSSADGAEALARLKSGVQPSLILLDMMMPRMSGAQFREEQLSDPSMREIPVLAMTGGGDAVVAKAAALGLEALRKPIELNQLVAVVERFCERPDGAKA
jgi:CheY-like chemotaxis protein